MPRPAMTKEDQRFRAEHDLHILTEADKIRGNKSRLEAAQRVAREQQKAANMAAEATSRALGTATDEREDV